jgi:hypothetical protein
MSVFIVFMPSPGLMFSPPVSKVIPLPMSTTCGVPAAPRGRQVASISRGGATDPPPTASTPPKPRSASHSASCTRTVTPSGVNTRSACTPSHAGVFVSDGVFARSRAQAVAAALRRPCSKESASSTSASSTTRLAGAGEVASV